MNTFSGTVPLIRPSLSSGISGQETDQLSLIGDIHLYNRTELGQRFHIPPHELKQLNDSDLVQRCYQEQGRHCLDALLGDFSFALLDSRTDTLFCAIDPLGVCSFFYTTSPDGTFYYSNRLSMIVQSKFGGTPLNTAYLVDYLSFRYQSQGTTPFRDLFTLPPGHYLMLRNGTVSVHQYWSPGPGDQSSPTPDKEPTEQLHDLLVQAVQCRIPSRQKTGLLVSGGLDSSAIGCIADAFATKTHLQLQGFSNVPCRNNPTNQPDERHYLECLQRAMDTPVHLSTSTHRPTPERLYTYFDACASFPYNPFLFTALPLYELVASQGTERLLTGYGGDEIVSTFGHGCLASLAGSGDWLRLFRLLRQKSRIEGEPVIQLFKKEVLKRLLPETFIRLYQRARGTSPMAFFSKSFLRKDILQQDLTGKYAQKRPGYYDLGRPDPREDMRQMLDNGGLKLYFSINDYLWDTYSFRQVYPLLDRRIVEFMLQVPVAEFITDGWSRSLFRRAMATVLPPEIRQRLDKTPFAPPFSRLMLESREFLLNPLETQHSKAWEILDYPKLKATAHQLLKNREEPALQDDVALNLAMSLNIATLSNGTRHYKKVTSSANCSSRGPPVTIVLPQRAQAWAKSSRSS